MGYAPVPSLPSTLPQPKSLDLHAWHNGPLRNTVRCRDPNIISVDSWVENMLGVSYLEIAVALEYPCRRRSMK